jgi:integrase
MDAVMRWLDESRHKRTLYDDKIHLRWTDSFFRNKLLIEIDQDQIEALAKAREETNVSPATINRMLEVIRAILRKAQKEWGWVSSVPAIRMRKVDNKRIRWLSQLESRQLLAELPPHLQDMAMFTLCTGLRESNVTKLKWQDIDLKRRHTLVHPDESKTKKAIPVPLNTQAIEIIKLQNGKHPIYVFTYHGHPVTRCNNHAWRKALIRAGIDDFRWHDLRHTWASWHVQNGTSLQELQQLGGWSNFETVLRYAHLSSNHLQAAAERVCINSL